eukprot:SM001327S27067  [mRNA]  locus=s1327:1006:1681:- [translate_table: standard]
MSSILGARFDPIRYTLTGTHIASNVKYSSQLLGDGWLSASGDFEADGLDAVRVLFDSFWWDIGRDDLKPDPQGQGSWQQTSLNNLGRALFFPQLSTFPVLYLDQDLVVFNFPPLSTNIAAHRVGT